VGSSGPVEGTIGFIIGLVVAANVGDDIVVGEDIVLITERDILRFRNKTNAKTIMIRTKTTPPTAPPMTAELFNFRGDGDGCTDNDVVGSGL
jgi:hypothetical protein